jgi:hypothetical protein
LKASCGGLIYSVQIPRMVYAKGKNFKKIIIIIRPSVLEHPID